MECVHQSRVTDWSSSGWLICVPGTIQYRVKYLSDARFFTLRGFALPIPDAGRRPTFRPDGVVDARPATPPRMLLEFAGSTAASETPPLTPPVFADIYECEKNIGDLFTRCSAAKRSKVDRAIGILATLKSALLGHSKKTPLYILKSGDASDVLIVHA